jgi:hypothetical protein
VRVFLDEVVAGDAAALAGGAAAPPHRDAYAGLVAVTTELLARRERRFADFLALWRDLERKGFRPRLEYAVAERPGANGRATIGAA